MGKKKFTFEQLTELRSNKEEFLKVVFENYTNRDFFTGELQLKSFEKDKDDKTIVKDKWIFFTQEERTALIQMAVAQSEAEKAEIFAEDEKREKRAIVNPLRIDAEDYEVGMIVCKAVEEGQTINKETFNKAYNLVSKHKEFEGPLWKSYRFKGFVTWEQIEKAMEWKKEHSNSKA